MILFHVSGHGLGHMSREGTVMRALKKMRPDLNLGLRTPTPEWFVREAAPEGAVYSPAKIDVGVLQSDSLGVKPLQTLEKYAELISRREEIVSAEAEWCREHSVELMVADIPPLAFDIAERIGVPSICVANFSWDWIYQPYIESHPAYGYVVEDIIASESKCGLCLYTPFSGDLSAFPMREKIPLIGRKSPFSRREARSRLGLPEGKTALLFSFGGFGLDMGAGLKPDVDSDTVMITTRPDMKGEGWVYLSRDDLRSKGLEYPDLVKAVDAVITKPGYGIVSECIANGAGMLYVEREMFPEYEVLVSEMGRYIPEALIPLKDFYAGKWGKYLRSLLNDRRRLEPISTNGAERVAEIISKAL